MNAVAGYRMSKAAGGGLYNGFAAPKAKQAWTVGAVVNVGFVKGLVVEAFAAGEYQLRQASSGKRYTFAPHEGLYAVR